MKVVKAFAAIVVLCLLWELRWLFVLGFIAIVAGAVIVYLRRRKARTP